MKRNPLIAIIAGMVVCLILVFTLNLMRPSHNPRYAIVRGEGEIARNFALQSLDGKEVQLSDFHGKTVLLNFWETSCEPCRIEIPWFVELQKQYGPQGLQIVGIVMDEGTKTKNIADYAKEMRVDYPILVGKSVRNVADDYGGVPFFPETFYIDRNGKVLDESIGLKSRREVEEEIKNALGLKRDRT